MQALLAVLLGAAALLWPAVYNGRPPVFADTAYYYSLGEYASELAGWVTPGEARLAPGDPTRLQAKGPGGPSLAFTIMGARAPAYALFLYGSQRLGGLWLTAWLQALAVSWSVWLLARGAAPRRTIAAFAVSLAAAAALSPLPFFAGFAMPDVFGFAAAALAVAGLVWWEGYGRAERAGLVGLLLFALTVHGSHPLTAFAVAAAGGALLWAVGAGRGPAVRRAAGLAALAAAAIALDAGGFALLGRAGGEPLRRPPFLSARLLADGPGRTWLRRACAAEPDRYALCADAAKPLSNSDVILWRDEPWLGVFSPAAYPRRLRMIAEDGRFARDVALHGPLALGLSAISNWGLQLERAYVDDPLTNPAYWMRQRYWRRTSLAAITPDAGPCRSARRGCPALTRAGPLRVLHLTAAGLAAAWLAGRGLAGIAGRRPWPDWRNGSARIAAAALLLSVAVLVNAAVCGMISGPYPRYQARIVGLLPIGVVLLEFGLAAGRRRGRGTPAA